MDPTPLLGAGVVVICGVEVAGQHPTEALARRLVDDRLAATATQEVPLAGSAERPHIAVDSALSPAGLVGVHHGASPNALPHVGHRRSGRLRHPVNHPDDGARAYLQPIHRPQVGPDRPDRQPLLLTQRRYQAHQTDAQALPSHGHAVRRQPGNPASFACRAYPRDQDVLGDLDRGRRYVDDLPGPLNPSAGQSRPALGTGLESVHLSSGGFHAPAGKAALTLLARLSLIRLVRLTAAGRRLVARHAQRPATGQNPPLRIPDASQQFVDGRPLLGVGRLLLGEGRLQFGVGRLLLGKGRLQFGVGRLLLGEGRLQCRDDHQQGLPACIGEVCVEAHTPLVARLTHDAPDVSVARFVPFTPNSYWAGLPVGPLNSEQLLGCGIR